MSIAHAQASYDIGGERAAAVLPLMLKPGAMGKMPAEQRAKLRQVTGESPATHERDCKANLPACGFTALDSLNFGPAVWLVFELASKHTPGLCSGSLDSTCDQVPGLRAPQAYTRLRTSTSCWNFCRGRWRTTCACRPSCAPARRGWGPPSTTGCASMQLPQSEVTSL